MRSPRVTPLSAAVRGNIGVAINLASKLACPMLIAVLGAFHVIGAPTALPSLTATRIWSDDVYKLEIKTVSTGTGGQIVAGGKAYSSSGVTSGFLALIGADGHVLKILRTAPFVPFDAAIAAKGSIWLLGRESPEDGIHESPHNVLQQYNSDGKFAAGISAA